MFQKNGWRAKEPGDVPGRMGDTISQGAIDLLFDGGYMTVDKLLRDFASYGIILSQKDLENSMCLREGTLKHIEKILFSNDKTIWPDKTKVDVYCP